MSTATKKFILTYFCLVILPVIGLLVVLTEGRGLQGPVSVNGTWKLQMDARQLSGLPCGKFLADGLEPTFTISQSGKRFTLTLASQPKAAGSGVVEGTELKVWLSPAGMWANESGCGNDRRLTLVATVDPKAEPRSLAGAVSVSGCPSCTPVELHAIREVPTEENSIH